MIGRYDPIGAEKAIIEAVGYVFANMAFIDVSLSEDGEASRTRDCRPAEDPLRGSDGIGAVRASIDLLEPGSGRLELRMPAALRARIVDALYCGDAETPAGQKEDTELELLNALAGQFMTRYFGTNTSIWLGLPRSLAVGEDVTGAIILDLVFDAEGFLIRVILSSKPWLP